jgi:RNA polymerase sigma factor (sigma-70 family)
MIFIKINSIIKNKKGGLILSRKYLSLLAVDILQIAEKNWNNLQILTELYEELSFRNSKASQNAKENITTRIQELRTASFTIEEANALNLTCNEQETLIKSSENLDGKIKKNKASSLEMSLIDAVIAMNGSVRLKNILKRAHYDETMPVSNVEEYLRLASPISDFKKMYGSGAKTAKELYDLIQDFIKDDFKIYSDNDTDRIENSLDNDISSLSLIDLVNVMNASVRLINALNLANHEGLLPAKTIGEYIALKFPKDEFKTLQNAGKKTIDELDAIISKVISEKGLVFKKSHNPQDHSVEPVFNTIDEAVNSTLNDKEIEILVGRGLKKLTLQDIGDEFDITRERVRQIEKKAILKLIKQLSLERKVELFEKKMKENGGGLSLSYLSEALDASYNATFILAHAFTFIGKPKKLVEDVLYFKEVLENNSLWNSILNEYIFNTPWPIKLSLLEEALGEIPVNYALSFFEKKGSILNDAKTHILAFSNLTHKFFINQVFLFEKGPLHFSDLTSKVNARFNLELGERVIHNAVGNMSEALIVDRGVYNTYENLGVDDNEIQLLVEKIKSYLSKSNEFVSVQVLYEVLFNESKPEWLESYYVLFGVMQDFGNFETRRGLMVGLEQHSGNFISLSELIVKVIKDYGPISASDIQLKLSNTRKFFSHNIDTVVGKDISVLKSGYGLYDCFERVFKTEKIYQFCVWAIEIALSDVQDISTKNLLKRIKSIEKNIGINLNNQILLYIVNRENRTFSIKEDSISLLKMSHAVEDYFYRNKPLSSPLKKIDSSSKLDTEEDFLSGLLKVFG